MANTDYIYFRKPLKPSLKQLLDIAPEELYARLHNIPLGKPVLPELEEFSLIGNIIRTLFGAKSNNDLKAAYQKEIIEYQKEIKKYRLMMDEGQQLRRKIVSDKQLLLLCLGGTPLDNSKISEKKDEGYISLAEEELFQMLCKINQNNWRVYQQVAINAIRNPNDFGRLISEDIRHPIDIVIITNGGDIYAVELDGPHHMLIKQRDKDDERDSILLNLGFNIIRIGYDKFVKGYTQTLQEIMLIINGQISSEYTNRPEAYIDGKDEYDTLNKQRDFYNRQSRSKTSTNRIINEYKQIDQYCFIYCQSTGIEKNSQVVDFSLLIINKDGIKEFYSKIKPGCPIGSKASSMHGIYQKDVENCPSLHNYIEKNGFKKLFEDDKTLVITYDWGFTARIIKNSMPAYLNWDKINLYSTVSTIRLRYNLDNNYSTMNDAINALKIPSNKYKRFNSKDYVRLVLEMFKIVYP